MANGIIVLPWWRKIAKQWSTIVHGAGLAVVVFGSDVLHFLSDQLPDVWERIPGSLRDSLPEGTAKYVAGSVLFASLALKFFTTQRALAAARARTMTPEPVVSTPTGLAVETKHDGLVPVRVEHREGV
jgi:hypothetical protein